jgi:hypothetical protein
VAAEMRGNVSFRGDTFLRPPVLVTAIAWAWISTAKSSAKWPISGQTGDMRGQ